MYCNFVHIKSIYNIWISLHRTPPPALSVPWYQRTRIGIKIFKITSIFSAFVSKSFAVNIHIEIIYLSSFFLFIFYFYTIFMVDYNIRSHYFNTIFTWQTNPTLSNPLKGTMHGGFYLSSCSFQSANGAGAEFGAVQ